MISVLFPGWLVGALTFAIMLPILVFWGGLLLIPLALLRLLLPFAALQGPLSKLMVAVATQWVASNQLVYRLMHAPQWQIDWRAQLDPSKSYLLISNHQTWADILVVFDLLHGRTHFLRFFLKQELIWVPIVGTACWALDMPFMKRHSREAVARNPALRGEDLATTRRFCEKYRTQPITVVNFLEGTRFTQAKRAASDSPYRHLLKPKAAGLSFTLNAMGEQFDAIIDVTIAYQATPRAVLWSWLRGEQTGMSIHVDTLPIPPEMIRGDYEADTEFRARFQHWVNSIWARKDTRLDHMLSAANPTQARPRLT